MYLSIDDRYALCALTNPDGMGGKIICVPYKTIVRIILPENKVMIKYPNYGISQSRKRPRTDPHSDDLIIVEADLIYLADYDECQKKLAAICKSQRTTESRKRGQKSKRAEEIEIDRYGAPKAKSAATPSKRVTFPPEIQITVSSRYQQTASTNAAAQDQETSTRQSNENRSENEGQENQDHGNQGAEDELKKALVKNIAYFFDNLEIMIKRWKQDVHELKVKCLNRFAVAEDIPKGVRNGNVEVQNGNERENEVKQEKESEPITPKPKKKPAGIRKSRGKPCTAENSVKVPLPTNFDPNDPRWTLRYPEPGPGLMELSDNSNVYIKSDFFKSVTAVDRRSFAELLLHEIYNDEALKSCLFPSRYLLFIRDANYRERDKSLLYFLHKHALTVLLETVSKIGDIRGWPPVREKGIVTCLRMKMNRLYNKNSANFR